MSVDFLRHKLMARSVRVNLRYKYYEAKNIAADFQISTPPHLRWLYSSLGWCGKAVDVLADRLICNGFDQDKDSFDLNSIFRTNNPDVFFDSAILSALISSCCFVYVYTGEDGEVRLQVIDGANATGNIDPINGMLTEGYAVLDRNEAGLPSLEAYFTPGNVRFFQYEEGKEPKEWDVPNNVQYPLLVPIIYKPDAKRPFGHSRITRGCMSLVDSALRTVKRSEIAAEFYSYPQKYVTGLAQDAEIADTWQANMSAMMALYKDEDGDHPIVGQFSQQSMTPHTEQLKMLAAMFAGETSLTLDDLGFPSGNPSSYEAIKAQHENLRLVADKAQRCFGTGFLNVGIVAACLRDDYDYERSAFSEELLWSPTFTLDGTALAGMGDAVLKINQAMPDYIDAKKLGQLTGI